MWHVAKWGLTCWRGGRGRRGLVSSEMWHGTKRGLTCWRGERGGEAGWGFKKRGTMKKGAHLLGGGEEGGGEGGGTKGAKRKKETGEVREREKRGRGGGWRKSTI